MKILTGQKIDWTKSGVEIKNLPKEQVRDLILQERPFSISKEDYTSMNEDGKTDYKKTHSQWYLLGDTSDHTRDSKAWMTERGGLVFDIEYDAPQGFPERLHEKSGNEIWYYTSINHMPEKPRYRVIIPFKEPLVDGDIEQQYKALCVLYARKYGFLEICDPKGWNPKQAMYFNHTLQGNTDKESGYFEGEELDYVSLLKDVDYDFVDEESKRIENLHKGEKPKKRRKSDRQDPKNRTNDEGLLARAYGMREGIEKFLNGKLEYVSEGVYRDPKKSSPPGIKILPETKMHDNDCLCYVHYANHDKGDDHAHTLYELLEIYLGRKKLKKIIETDPRVEQEFYKMLQDKRELDLNNFPLSKLPRDSKTGKVLQSPWVIEAILRSDPDYKGIGYLDTLRYVVITTDELAWKKGKFDPKSPEWKNDDYSGLYQRLSQVYEFKGHKHDMMEALTVIWHSRAVQPFTDKYLEELPDLEWPEDAPFKPEETFYWFLGGENDEIKKVSFRYAMIALIHRSYNPGATYDYAHIFQGPQGIGKSAFFKTLLPDESWFGTLDDASTKDAWLAIKGKLVVELEEMRIATSPFASQKALKSLITRRYDEFRPPYGREIERFPRKCIFVGTANDDQFLRDPTGERRYIVTTHDGLDENGNLLKETDGHRMEDLEKYRDYLWAWAKREYQKFLDSGRKELRLTPEEEKIAELAREPFRQELSVEARTIAYLKQLKPKEWNEWGRKKRREWLAKVEGKEAPEDGVLEIERVSTLEISCEVFGYESTDSGKAFDDNRRAISRALVKHGWVSKGKKTLYEDYGHAETRCYQKPTRR